jgi:glycosyltransferase involved in cell wall biosynthesis
MTNAGRPLVCWEATSLESARWSGVGHYTASLLQSLAQQEEALRYVLLLRSLPAAALSFPLKIYSSSGFLPRSLWMQFAVPRAVARFRPDLCHFSNSLAPLFISCPYVVTVYDMSLHLYPQMHPRKSLVLVKSLLPISVRRAAAVITISHSAKNDIVRLLGVPPERVHVVYGAPSAGFRPDLDPAELDRIRDLYGLHEPYILAVSTLEPRKNLTRLIGAFAILRRRGRREQLLLVGQPGWQYQPILQMIERLGLKECVRLMGYLPSDHLPGIYKMASAVAFPSVYEGFGLPIVEAMACGTPVLTSDRSSMAELGTGAAVLVNPYSEEEIENGLFRLLTEDPLREQLRAAGFSRASEFSWERAARDTVSLYLRLANG